MQSTFLKSHFIDLLFVIIFLLCLCIPNLHLSQAEKSEEENRMLAKYIPLVYDKKINWNYGVDFEKFYNDRFYCRRKLIELNSIVKTSFFSVNIYANTLIGKDGWLFNILDRSEYNFLNYDLFDTKELEEGLKYLTDIKSWCDANGKIFVFMICPDKNKIYGEYFPKGYKKVRPDTASRAFQFINYVRENSDISIVYPYEELITEKSKGRILYYKQDTHWNYDGAYIGYKALIKELKEKIDIDEVEILGMEEEKFIAKDLNNKIFSPDETIYYKPKIRSDYKKGKVTKETHSKHTYEEYPTICETKKHSVIFFRDSFTNAMVPFLSNTFQNVMYHWHYDIRTEDLEYIKNNTDIVILECVERRLPSMLTVAKYRPFPQN